MVPVQFAAFPNRTRRSAAANCPFIVGSTHAICWPGRNHFLWITLSYNPQLFLAWLFRRQLKPVICGINWCSWNGRASAFTNYQHCLYQLNVILPHQGSWTHQPWSKACVGQVQWLETADLPPSCKTTTTTVLNCTIPVTQLHSSFMKFSSFYSSKCSAGCQLLKLHLSKVFNYSFVQRGNLFLILFIMVSTPGNLISKD